VGRNINATANLTREEFFRIPWWDWAEGKSREGASSQRGKGENGAYDDVFALRQHKLEIMRQAMGAVGPHRVKIVSLGVPCGPAVDLLSLFRLLERFLARLDSDFVGCISKLDGEFSKEH